jgi:hypothetical protein
MALASDKPFSKDLPRKDIPESLTKDPSGIRSQNFRLDDRNGDKRVDPQLSLLDKALHQE